MTEHVTSTSWVLFFKVLSVNKLCPVQFVKCPTKRKIWKDICPLNKEKLFPALNIVSCIGNIVVPNETLIIAEQDTVIIVM